MSNSAHKRGVGTERLLEKNLLRLVAASTVVAQHYLSTSTEKDGYSLSFGFIFEWGDSLAVAAHCGSLGIGISHCVNEVVATSCGREGSIGSLAGHSAFEEAAA